ncbi:hypothetical protein R3P38DRAFT_2961736 [Favolaschia claudopus]|uniref:F-box domain-containing protein n=1 Tax=Favolaschia claudopus TaxID=2862362 RepID=A0AAW0B961_9AGAR
MKPPSPLDVQELVDLCIDHLFDDPETLASCSLVARSWVDAAQAKLFCAPHLTNCEVVSSNRIALKLHKVLSTSPHLLRHVRSMFLSQTSLHHTTDAKLAQLGSSRLDTLSLQIANTTNNEIHIGSLMRYPNLRRLRCFFPFGFSGCARYMENFSSTVEHLDLECFHWELIHFNVPIDSQTVPRIQLKSLYLNLLDKPKQPQRLWPTALYPFGLGRLKYLGVWRARLIQWDTIPHETNQSIEELQIGIEDTELVDLSPLIHLRTLHLILLSPNNVIPPGCRYTIASLTAHHRVDVITLWVGDLDFEEDDESRQLDLVLSTLPLEPRPTVEFESSIKKEGREESLKRLFPKLVAQNQFRIVYCSWPVSEIGRRIVLMPYEVRVRL